jgi:2-hydroxychromene-2-carboxylate isomerase
MQDQASVKELKMYSDYKSPYAFLAFDPAFELENRFKVSVRWKPFQLRIKGSGQRSAYSEYKVKYSYMDARRWANKRGGIMLKGPLKIYDTVPALIGGLFAERHGKLREYSRIAFGRFFRREFEADRPDEVSALVASLGLSEEAYREYLAGEGQLAYEHIQEEAAADHIFGVPMFVFEGEQFRGYDRMGLLEERLAEAGLKLAQDSAA